MDSLSQIVLGAATAEAVAGKKLGNKAILWGAIGGTIPDLDIFVKFNDPLKQLIFHRGPSHSLLFAVVMAPILGWLLWKINKRTNATWRDWTLLFLVSIGTHPILDSFTSWGTQLFWPFIDYRVAWNTIFVVDPLYTIPFLLFVIVAMFFKQTNPTRAKINRAGLVISSLYLAFTVFNKMGVDSVIEDSLAEQNIEYSQFMSNPTPMNNVLWYTIVDGTDKQYLGYYSILDKDKTVQFMPFDKGPELPENVKTQEHYPTIMQITKGYYLTEQKDDSTYWIRDFRFGIMNGAAYEQDQTLEPEFIFAYTIDNSDPAKPEFGVIEPDRSSEQVGKMGALLELIFERAKGR